MGQALSNVFDKLELLKKTKKNNTKKELLERFLKDPEFMEVCKLTLAHDLIFHISKMEKYIPTNYDVTSQEIFDFLRELATKSGTKKWEKETLRNLASINEKTYEVVRRIVNKNLGCNVGASLINQVLPGTIFVMPYMRCMTEKEGLSRITFPAVCQKKADGAFAYGMIGEDGTPVLMSRNGLKIDLLGVFDTDIENLREEDLVITMELTAKDADGNDLPRTYGNGLVSKAIEGTITQAEAQQLHAQCWDIVPQEQFWAECCETPYLDRWKQLNTIVRKSERFHRIESRIVNDLAEARRFFFEMRQRGLEGAVLKNMYGIWKSYTSPDQCKLKRKHQAEFIITGWYYGDADKKYEKCIGGISFESACGMVKANTGSGLTDADRGFLGFDDNMNPIIDEKIFEHWDSQIGKIIGIEFDSLVQDKNNKNKDEYSLFLPIYLDVRVDKNEADDLAYLLTL